MHHGWSLKQSKNKNNPKKQIWIKQINDVNPNEITDLKFLMLNLSAKLSYYE